MYVFQTEDTKLKFCISLRRNEREFYLFAHDCLEVEIRSTQIFSLLSRGQYKRLLRKTVKAYVNAFTRLFVTKRTTSFVFWLSFSTHSREKTIELAKEKKTNTVKMVFFNRFALLSKENDYKRCNFYHHFDMNGTKNKPPQAEMKRVLVLSKTRRGCGKFFEHLKTQ